MYILIECIINRDTKKGRTPHAPLFYISLLKSILYSFYSICLTHLMSLLLDGTKLWNTQGTLGGTKTSTRSWSNHRQMTSWVSLGQNRMKRRMIAVIEMPECNSIKWTKQSNTRKGIVYFTHAYGWGAFFLQPRVIENFQLLLFCKYCKRKKNKKNNNDKFTPPSELNLKLKF